MDDIIHNKSFQIIVLFAIFSLIQVIVYLTRQSNMRVWYLISQEFIRLILVMILLFYDKFNYLAFVILFVIYPLLVYYIGGGVWDTVTGMCSGNTDTEGDFDCGLVQIMKPNSDTILGSDSDTCCIDRICIPPIAQEGYIIDASTITRSVITGSPVTVTGVTCLEDEYYNGDLITGTCESGEASYTLSGCVSSIVQCSDNGSGTSACPVATSTCKIAGTCRDDGRCAPETNIYDGSPCSYNDDGVVDSQCFSGECSSTMSWHLGQVGQDCNGACTDASRASHSLICEPFSKSDMESGTMENIFGAITGSACQLGDSGRVVEAPSVTDIPERTHDALRSCHVPDNQGEPYSCSKIITPSLYGRGGGNDMIHDQRLCLCREPELCAPNEKVVSHNCVGCPVGTTAQSHDPYGDDTVCTGELEISCVNVNCPPATKECKIAGTCQLDGSCSDETNAPYIAEHYVGQHLVQEVATLCRNGKSICDGNGECMDAPMHHACFDVTCEDASSECKQQGQCQLDTGTCSPETNVTQNTPCNNGIGVCSAGVCDSGRCDDDDGSGAIGCPDASSACMIPGTCQPDTLMCSPETNNCPDPSSECKVRGQCQANGLCSADIDADNTTPCTNDDGLMSQCNLGECSMLSNSNGWYLSNVSESCDATCERQPDNLTCDSDFNTTDIQDVFNPGSDTGTALERIVDTFPGITCRDTGTAGSGAPNIVDSPNIPRAAAGEDQPVFCYYPVGADISRCSMPSLSRGGQRICKCI